MSVASLSLRSDLADLDRMRSAADAFIGPLLEEIDKNRVILALDEAFVNIVQHGYGPGEHPPIELEMRRMPGGLEFRFHDRAPEFDPTKSGVTIDSDHSESGKDHGLGIHLYSTIMKPSYSKRPGGGNSLTLFKAIRG